MRKSRKAFIIGVLLLCTVMVSACSGPSGTASSTVASAKASTSANVTTASAQITTSDVVKDITFDEDDAYTDWEVAKSTTITLNGTSASISGSGAVMKDGKVAISAAGTYVISGKLDNGQIVVNVANKGTVRLVLNGVELHNSSTSPIYVEKAGKTIISLAAGTQNTVSDGQTYVYPDASTDEPNAAIFSKDDLTINGTGTLTVKGNYNNGITSKDALKITGGVLNIDAADDALMGRDLVAISAGDITIQAGGHGIKTTNDTEGSEGVIAISGGSFQINAEQDGLNSTGGIQITGGTLAIAVGDDGIHADISLAIIDGTVDITKSNEGLEAMKILIAGGTTHVVASDDGVNAASGTDSAEGGGDPGMQNGSQPEPPTGSQQGTQPELPGEPPTGTQSGSQSASQSDSQSQPKAPPQMAAGSSNNQLVITGGHLTVNAQGDGLDANGSIFMSGGTVLVHGPTSGGNGALDYDSAFNMTGGLLIAAGSSGMAQAASDQSTQNGILMTYSQTQQAGTLLHLEDSEGNNIATFAPVKNYQSVFISSPDLKQGATYTLYSGGTSTGQATSGLYEDGTYQGGTKVVQFELSKSMTWLNESGVTEAQSGGMMGGPRGGGGGNGGRGMGRQ